MPAIIPLRDLKNASEVSKLVHDSDTPVFVTKNGEADLVIMTSELYDKLFVEKFVNGNGPAHPSANRSSSVSDVPYTIFGLKELLTPICEKSGVEKLVLYGSYTEGIMNEETGIEMAVKSELRGVAANHFLKEVNEALHYPVGLVELGSIPAGTEMDRIIRKTGVTLYEKPETVHRKPSARPKKKASDEEENPEG